MNEFDHRSFLLLLKQKRERPENSSLNGDLNLDLCDAGAVLYQLSDQANWEQVVMWVDYGLIINPHNDLLPVGLIAQLVEHCPGFTEVRV